MGIVINGLTQSADVFSHMAKNGTLMFNKIVAGGGIHVQQEYGKVVISTESKDEEAITVITASQLVRLEKSGILEVFVVGGGGAGGGFAGFGIGGNVELTDVHGGGGGAGGICRLRFNVTKSDFLKFIIGNGGIKESNGSKVYNHGGGATLVYLNDECLCTASGGGGGGMGGGGGGGCDIGYGLTGTGGTDGEGGIGLCGIGMSGGGGGGCSCLIDKACKGGNGGNRGGGGGGNGCHRIDGNYGKAGPTAGYNGGYAYHNSYNQNLNILAAGGYQTGGYCGDSGGGGGASTTNVNLMSKGGNNSRTIKEPDIIGAGGGGGSGGAKSSTDTEELPFKCGGNILYMRSCGGGGGGIYTGMGSCSGGQGGSSIYGMGGEASREGSLPAKPGNGFGAGGGGGGGVYCPSSPAGGGGAGGFEFKTLDPLVQQANSAFSFYPEAYPEYGNYEYGIQGVCAFRYIQAL